MFRVPRPDVVAWPFEMPLSSEGRRNPCRSFQKSCGKPVAVSVAILADTNVVAAARKALDDPGVTGMEITTACLNGGLYASVEIVLGCRHDPALVVQVSASVERNLEKCPLSNGMLLTELG
jgi:hypothetical protein